MPNGYDKNWVRLCAAVNGFRAEYGRWPTRVRLYAGALEDLRENVFSPESFARLTAKLRLVPDDTAMVAEDDEGRQYSYGEKGFPSSRPTPTAQEWLDVHPDRGEPA